MIPSPPACFTYQAEALEAVGSLVSALSLLVVSREQGNIIPYTIYTLVSD